MTVISVDSRRRTRTAQIAAEAAWPADCNEVHQTRRQRLSNLTVPQLLGVAVIFLSVVIVALAIALGYSIKRSSDQHTRLDNQQTQINELRHQVEELPR